MHQSRTSFSSSTPLHMASGQGGASSALMPGVRPFAQYDDDGLDPAAESLSRLHEWVGALDRYLRLPNSFQSFSVYLLGLILVFSGATLHIWVAAQIMQAKYELAGLEREYASIQQQNSELIFTIARDTNLNRIRERALAMGYVPISERQYVVVTDSTQPTVSQPTVPQSTAQSAPSAISPQRAQADSRTTPLRQWERFLRGEMTWETPTGSERNAQPAAATSPQTTSRLSPDNGGMGWEDRWQQMVEQGRQLFTKVDIR